MAGVFGLASVCIVLTAVLSLSDFLTGHWWVATLLLIAVYDGLGRLSPVKAGAARVVIPVVVVPALAWMVYALCHPLIGGLEGIARR